MDNLCERVTRIQSIVSSYDFNKLCSAQPSNYFTNIQSIISKKLVFKLVLIEKVCNDTTRR